MSANEFDRRVAEKLNEAVFTYDPGDWEYLTAQLDAARRKKRAILFAYTLPGVAASVAILILCTLFFSKKEVPVIAQHTANKKTTSPTPAPISLSDTTNDHTSPNATVVTHNSLPTPVLFANTKHKTKTIVANDGHTPTDTTVYNSAVPAENVVVKDRKEVVLPPICTGLPWKPELMPEPEKKKIHINVAGGINYGTLNTGYALGATVDRKLGKKLGIEVTVAYINNSSTTAMAPGNNSTPPYNMAGHPQNSTNVSYTTSPLNYLQFAPVAGYDIFKKVTVAAGADVQRLLQENDATIVYKDKTVIAPTLDMGVLLKTDYAVNNRLKGGVSYRIGANNLFTSSNYINRSYMQVQLKYRLH